MLLAVDVGNTQTVLGLYDGEARGGLAGRDRAGADRRRARRAARGLLDLDAVDGICLSSTVPRSSASGSGSPTRWAQAPLLVVGPASRPASRSATTTRGRSARTGSSTPSRPRSATARRASWSTSARRRTSTSSRPAGEYVGGVIAPGIEISMEALFARAARLVQGRLRRAAERDREDDGRRPPVRPRVRVRGPGRRDRGADPRRARGAEAQVVATGGLAELIAPHSATIERGRSVPDARGPAARLGAERVICSPERSRCSRWRRSLLAVSRGRPCLYIVTRSMHRGRRAGLASVSGSTAAGSCTTFRSRRPVRAPRLSARRSPWSSCSARLPGLARDPDAARRSRPARPGPGRRKRRDRPAASGPRRRPQVVAAEVREAPDAGPRVPKKVLAPPSVAARSGLARSPARPSPRPTLSR